MAKNNNNNVNNAQRPMGMPMGFGMPAANNNGGAGGKMTAKQRKEIEKKNLRREKVQTMRARQDFAMENNQFRRKLESVQGSGILGADYYTLPEDKKIKKRKDYFFIMRKLVCFIMFLLMLVSVAYYALSYLKLAAVPVQYTALFIETEAKDDTQEADETASEAEVVAADEATAPADDTVTEEEDATTDKASAFNGTTYNLLDPIFGFLRYVGGKLGINIDLGDSPLYDAMIAKVEVGMADKIASYIILAFPVALIIYVIIALVMMIKAFLGMFGKTIYKKFGLGGFLMIICAAITAFGGLAYTVDLEAKMEYAKVLDIIMGPLKNAGGFSGGYGLLIMLALPLLTLIFSMFAKKKIPYSIFDNFSV